MKNCLLCDRIKLIQKNKNPYFVKELQSGYVVLGDSQFYKGYTLLLNQTHISEHDVLANTYESNWIHIGYPEDLNKSINEKVLLI